MTKGCLQDILAKWKLQHILRDEQHLNPQIDPDIGHHLEKESTRTKKLPGTGKWWLGLPQ